MGDPAFGEDLMKSGAEDWLNSIIVYNDFIAIAVKEPFFLMVKNVQALLPKVSLE